MGRRLSTRRLGTSPSAPASAFFRLASRKKLSKSTAVSSVHSNSKLSGRRYTLPTCTRRRRGESRSMFTCIPAFLASSEAAIVRICSCTSTASTPAWAVRHCSSATSIASCSE